VGQQPVGQCPVQRSAVLGQPAVQLSHLSLRVFSGGAALPGAAAALVGAVGVEAAGPAGAMLPIQVPLHTAQPGGVQADPIG